MNTNPDKANGKRLKQIREGAGFSSRLQAVNACNKESERLNSRVVFSEKMIKRFEEIGTPATSSRYGPTYEELHIMMRTYNGSLAYLIWGVPPSHYPFEHYQELIQAYLEPKMLEHVVWLAQMPTTKRLKILALLKEVAT